jgi:KUP system potassium uptake protein
VLVLTWTVHSVPRIAETNRLAVTQEGPDFWRVDTNYGFMETPNVLRVLAGSRALGCNLDLADVTYYVGRETTVARDDC